MKHQLWGLRGQTFVRRKQELFIGCGENLSRRFQEIVSANGKFSAKHLGLLANEFRLPLTVLDDFLSKLVPGRYASGTWDRLQDRGVKASDLGVNWE